MKDVSETEFYENFFDRMRVAGLRPTSQRLMLGSIIWSDGKNRHITAEELLNESRSKGMRVSLATIYNTLNQFKDAGLLKEICVGNGKSYFDTNISSHSHFMFEDTNRLEDIDEGFIEVSNLPPAPAGTEISDVRVVVRVRPKQNA